MKNDEELIPIIHFDCHFCYRDYSNIPISIECETSCLDFYFTWDIFGLTFTYFFGYLNRQYPDLLLTEYCKKILGKYIGTIIGIFYILFLCMVLHEILEI